MISRICAPFVDKHTTTDDGHINQWYFADDHGSFEMNINTKTSIRNDHHVLIKMN